MYSGFLGPDQPRDACAQATRYRLSDEGYPEGLYSFSSVPCGGKSSHCWPIATRAAFVCTSTLWQENGFSSQLSRGEHTPFDLPPCVVVFRAPLSKHAGLNQRAQVIFARNHTRAWQRLCLLAAFCSLQTPSCRTKTI